MIPFRLMVPVPVAVSGQFAGTPGVFRHSEQADLYDNNRATSQTVDAMARHIRYCARDPYIRWAALDAVRSWGNRSPIASPGDVAGNDDGRRAAWAAWWWVKHNCTFASDDEQLLRLLNERDQLELLITPSVMVRLQDRRGDCDDFTMLVCCLLESLGLPWVICTVACDPSDPERWSHVFAGFPSSAGVIPLDASHGKYPGWHIPFARMYRLQEWGRDGRPLGKEQRPMNGGIRGLHGYTAGMGAMGPRYRRRRRGIGDDGDGSTASLANVFTDIGVSPDIPLGSANQYGSVPIVQPASSGNPALTNALASEAASFTKIFGQLVAPQTTIQSGPGGTLITGPSGAIANTSVPALSTVGGLSMSSLLLIGGALVVGLIAVKAVSGK